MRPPPHHFEIKTPVKKGKWSPEEDKLLIAYIRRYGIWNWTEMPKAAGLSRLGKSCRLRWMNYLRPNIKRGNFTRDEEEIILHLHEMLGNKWSAIAAILPGRTDNEIKNFWHSYLKKRANNNTANTNGLQRIELPSIVDTQVTQQESTKQEVSLPTSVTPICSNPQEVALNVNIPMFSPRISSSSSNIFGKIEETQIIEKNISFFESSEETKYYWDHPISMEDLYLTEANYNCPMYADDQYLWYEESSSYPYASINDDGANFWANL